MELIVAAFGLLGLGFGRLGASRIVTSTPPATPEAGNPIGLLLTLTYPA